MPTPNARQLEPHEEELRRKQELLRKVRITRDRLQLQRSQVSGLDPKFHYAWICTDEVQMNSYHALGYEVCKDESVVSPFKREDGSHKRGDTILMKCSRETKEILDLDSEIRSMEGVGAPKAAFLDYAQVNQIPASEIPV